MSHLKSDLAEKKVTFPTCKKAQIIELWCAEPVFFASRELSDTYYTEGVIGNYALAYALGWAYSPYRLTGTATTKPTYIEDLSDLDCYILPAWAIDNHISYRFERFNALSDAYWFAMSNNRVVINREDLPLKRTGKKPSSYRPSNFPQTGRLKMIERGNLFETIVFGEVELPEYIRVGKFKSKVKITVKKESLIEYLPTAKYPCKTYLNSADLPENISYFSFDILAIPPVSILKNLQFEGEAWRIDDFIVPANLKFCQS
ncbi:type I-D CRISPR-associated protein Cas5/Csc1 [Cyanobacterium stanieri LEGE 03274]|uniref:Type I-D CRISPR-associated protein Cas5/Csc1 n=1 Tax=Cyanobacterium stanieri LEGE 03274 TaxID=1828756 RepID=A0ABR9V3D5_9CHRO|nr:type I-D CRISPR-associated protein Cas5/Csc1 [Cyanobacterium stanieri]MBE9222405.1 type I-D CRISPR-associated protein Cas5/Csc1 [Cyanobacterium stanieri LEGE 03274]